MLRVLSKEEELQSRRKAFAKLTPGSLFDLAQERFFIAVKKIDEKAWEVIELTEANKKKLISRQRCEHSVVHFSDMACLNLRQLKELGS
jgi:hypothetical protein